MVWIDFRALLYYFLGRFRTYGPAREDMLPLTFMLRFPDEDVCWKFLEDTFWPRGPACLSCGSIGDAAPWKPRPHRWQCRACGNQFHAAQETALAGSHVRMDLWFQAMYVMALNPSLSAKALSGALDLRREKTAWSMQQRIRKLITQDSILVRNIVAAVEGYRAPAA
jgi:Transposase zinc-ribbon domain